MSGDLGNRSDLDDLAGVEDRYSIGERVGVDGIVGDQQPHPVERLEMSSQVVANTDSGSGIQRRERLVEEQHLWVGRQCSRQCDPLRLTTRQRLWPV